MRKTLRISGLQALLATTMAVLPSTAMAQDDMVVMRRVVAAPTKIFDPNTMRPVDGADMKTYHWEVSGWFNPIDTCSAEAVETRLRGCVIKGEAAEENLCPQPGPETERSAPTFTGCTYSWTTAPSGDWADACSNETTRPVTATCRREDGATASDGRCADQPRPRTEKGSNYAGCSYSWQIGDYQPWDSSCSETTFRTRPVECLRSNGSVVSGSLCAGPAPTSRENGSNLAGCGFTWTPGSWSAPDSTCSTTAKQTRSSTCMRSDGKLVENSYCNPASEPAREQTVERLEGCGYEWVSGEFTEWSSTCSASSKRTRSVTCTRTDGETVEDDRCAGDKPAAQETADIATSCSYEWIVGVWEEPHTCSATAERKRDVTCRRSDDRTALSSFCDQPSRPASTETFADYSNCRFTWKTSGWSGWSSTCSNAATRTRTASCERTDGTGYADAFCDASAKPSLQESAPRYEGCSTYWVTGEWGDYNSTCSASSTRSRPVTCMQSQPDGDVMVEATKCSEATKPVASESTGIYTSCRNTWANGSWGWNGVTGATSSTCDTQAQQTQTPICRATLSNGTVVTVPDSNCSAATKPATTRTQSNITICTYQWIVGDWTPYNSTCSANATRTRDVACKQSDPLNSTVADNTCVSKGQGGTPQRSQSISNVTDCTGVLTNGGFENGTTGWNMNGSKLGTPAHSGSYSAEISLGKPISQQFQTTAGQKYAISMWSYAFGSMNAALSVDGVVVIPSPNTGGNRYWAQGGGTFTGTGGPVTISIATKSAWTFGETWIDDIVLSPVN